MVYATWRNFCRRKKVERRDKNRILVQGKVDLLNQQYRAEDDFLLIDRSIQTRVLTFTLAMVP
jgi:hypothetical protein